MKLAPFAITVCLLAGVAWERGSRPMAEDAAPFHQTVRDYIGAIPYRVGPWVGSDNPDPPPSAQQILRPNVIITRAFKHVDTGRVVSLLFVQCRDSRDMGGHYPPVCYPAHGWKAGPDRPDTTVTIAGVAVPVAHYTFELPHLDRFRKISITQFFALPGRGFATSMDAVREAASDYPKRVFGAAQMQLISESGISEDEERVAAEEILAPFMPVLRAIVGAGATPTDAAGAQP